MRQAVCAIVSLLGVAFSPASVRAAPAAAAEIALDLQAAGADSGHLRLSDPPDDSHLCAFLGPQTGRQLFLLVFNKPSAAVVLDAGRPGLFLTAKVPPDGDGGGGGGGSSDDTLQISIGGKRYEGLAQLDPAFHLALAFAADRSRGSFKAVHLTETGGTATLDVQGTWSCPPPPGAPTPAGPAIAEAPQAAPVVTPPATAIPATPPPPDPPPASPPDSQAEAPVRFRLARPDCADPSCGSWTATDVATGTTFAAEADLSALHLSERRRQSVLAGHGSLVIDGVIARPAANGQPAGIRAVARPATQPRHSLRRSLY